MFPLNSSWSYFPEPNYALLLPLLVVLSLVVEVGLFYGYFRKREITLVDGCAVIFLGNVASAFLGLLLYYATL